MIGSLSNFGEAVVLDSVFGRSSAYTFPGTLYFELFTALPDDSGANGTPVSTSGTGYARTPVSNTSTNFDPTPTSGGNKGIKTNKTAIVFPSALQAWGEVKGGGIYDASSGGNLLFLWEWDQSRIVAAGDTMRVEIGELKFTFNAEETVNADCLLSFAHQRAFLDAFFGNPSAPSIPTDLYAALMTTVPGSDEAAAVRGEHPTGGPGAELTIGVNGYARVQVPNDATRFPAYANGLKTNGQQIVWPQATGALSGVTAVAFYSAASAGTLVAKIKLDATQAWAAGDRPRLAASQLPILGD